MRTVPIEDDAEIEEPAGNRERLHRKRLSGIRPTGCPDCDSIQQRTGDRTMLCNECANFARNK